MHRQHIVIQVKYVDTGATEEGRRCVEGGDKQGESAWHSKKVLFFGEDSPTSLASLRNDDEVFVQIDGWAFSDPDPELVTKAHRYLQCEVVILSLCWPLKLDFVKHPLFPI